MEPDDAMLAENSCAVHGIDGNGSGGTLGGRGSAQKRCQALVKCDGNCNEMPVKTW